MKKPPRQIPSYMLSMLHMLFRPSRKSGVFLEEAKSMPSMWSMHAYPSPTNLLSSRWDAAAGN